MCACSQSLAGSRGIGVSSAGGAGSMSGQDTGSQDTGSQGTAEVIVASTRAASGEYEDRSGALAVAWLRDRGFEVPAAIIVADKDMPGYLGQRLADPARLPRILLTTGGTGLAADDRTVETVRPYLDKELPGVMMEFFRRGAQSVPTAVLSGGVAGTVGRTFVMTLPGSTGGVKDGLAVLEPLIEHIVAMLEGNTNHD